MLGVHEINETCAFVEDSCELVYASYRSSQRRRNSHLEDRPEDEQSSFHIFLTFVVILCKEGSIDDTPGHISIRVVH